MDGEEPTQATQNVLDPRRVGKQNSGFSDEDISDIICVLYPHSESAKQEVRRLAEEGSPHIIGRDEVDVEPDYELEDHASRFEPQPPDHCSHAIILRLSSNIKNPTSGFVFGRNHGRCDLVFIEDPLKRISNVHFRIYPNEHGNIMIEDQSTNGTFVDRFLLTTGKKGDVQKPVSKWVLSSGTMVKIYLHHQIKDLTFRVRIPRRDDEYERTYLAKVDDYFIRHGLKPKPTPPPPDGPPDIFKTPAEPATKPDDVTQPATTTGIAARRMDTQVRREWTGSGKYNRIGNIGKGAFAIVYKVTSKYDGNPYAAKELEKRRFIKNGILDQKVENEMKIMQRVDHPNIVRYIENFDWDDRLLIIIMEFIPGGDLGKLISDYGALSEEMVKTMSRQLLSALDYLHASNITHRDVKPDNILVSSYDPLVVKLTDFGLSKIVDSEQTFLRTFCGTLLYCAPEVYTEYAEYDDHGVRSRDPRRRRMPGQRYSHAVDVWSLGGVLFYCLTSSPPYPVRTGISHSELLHMIMQGNLDTRPLQNRRVSSEGIDFISEMLQRRPERRATVADLDVHPWLRGIESVVASQSYDEVTDDEDLPPTDAQIVDYDCDHISDSEKENDDDFNQHRSPPPAQRLFGEVGVSAIGSSGVIPNDFLNLPGQSDSMQEGTVILGSPRDETYESADSGPQARKRRSRERQNTASYNHQQSADQLQSLVENVASQSLGGDSPKQDAGSSRYSSVDFNASKRKPASYDTSDEFDENTAPTKPLMKRLRSEGNLEEVSESTMAEYKLLTCVPVIRRSSSGRQIDGPVNKVVYWKQDRATWHLNYPEMTQLQHDAFSEAAKARDEEFMPGMSPLWDLAMKHFGPIHRVNNRSGRSVTPAKAQPSNTETVAHFPPTAAPVEEEQRRNSPIPATQIVVPVQPEAGGPRMVAHVESKSASCVQGISFPVTDTFLSFGRALDNTESFEPKSEPKVPKYAFKLMLWREGHDTVKESYKSPCPWERDDAGGEEEYSFWMSTKATMGIRVNEHSLPSSEARDPHGPSRHWLQVFNGDDLVIWGGPDPRNQTILTFRCFWGASKHTRENKNRSPDLASDELAERLDIACDRIERKLRDNAEKRWKADDAQFDFGERVRGVTQERERSHQFEAVRAEAAEYLRAKQLSSRRYSPAYTSAFS